MGATDLLVLHANIAVEVRRICLARERPQRAFGCAHVVMPAVVRVAHQVYPKAAEVALEAALGFRAEGSARVRRVCRHTLSLLGVEFLPARARQRGVGGSSVAQTHVVASAVEGIWDEGVTPLAIRLAGFLARCNVAEDDLWVGVVVYSCSNTH